MITIDVHTVKELILRTEPGFMSQAELQINGFGTISSFSQNEDTWIWKKERFKNLSVEDLAYLITKVTE